MELGQKRSLGNMVMDLGQNKIGQHGIRAKKRAMATWRWGNNKKRAGAKK